MFRKDTPCFPHRLDLGCGGQGEEGNSFQGGFIFQIDSAGFRVRRFNSLNILLCNSWTSSQASKLVCSFWRTTNSAERWPTRKRMWMTRDLQHMVNVLQYLTLVHMHRTGERILKWFRVFTDKKQFSSDIRGLVTGNQHRATFPLSQKKRAESRLYFMDSENGISPSWTA